MASSRELVMNVMLGVVETIHQCAECIRSAEFAELISRLPVQGVKRLGEPAK
jgi:hypothetical protein